MLRTLVLLGLGLIPLALPLALLVGDQSLAGPLVLVMVGESGVGLTAVGLSG